MKTTTVEDFFEHHGIKGQKWGIRNAPAKKFSSDHKQAVSLKKKHLSELTNQEVKALNERLNLEANYKRLNPSKVQKGQSKAKEILGIAATATSLIALANTAIGKKLIKAGKEFTLRPSIKSGIRSIGK